MANKNRIIISCKIGFLNCWKPDATYGNKKYSMIALISKEDEETIKKIHDAIEFVKEQSVEKWGGAIPDNLRLPLHDGDKEKPGNAIFKGCYYMNAKSKSAPQIVDQNVKAITDHSELYPGCYGNVSIIFYAYNHCGNKGISACLGNIQKVRDGMPLYNTVQAAAEFKPVPVEEYL